MSTNSPLPLTRIDSETGEEQFLIKYREGRPRQVRFDAKEGVFKELKPGTTDQLQVIGKSLTFQPIAWRFFKGNILNMGQKEWVELFFVDEQNRLSALLLHSWSVENLRRIEDPLFYEGDATLADVVLTIETEKKENTKITPKGVYYIAMFSYVMADTVRTQQLTDYAEKNYIYRMETIDPKSVIEAVHNYRLPQPVLDQLLGVNSEPIAIESGK